MIDALEVAIHSEPPILDIEKLLGVLKGFTVLILSVIENINSYAHVPLILMIS